MKKKLSARRGSALLIVLGILSFMVVSAVAFSVLMRQSRLPSSFMRQKVTSAYLVKAGLANAMAELDECIGDNPYPGVGTSGNTTDFGNYWYGNRIFLRQDVTGATAGSGSAVAIVADQDGAASTMPLEGLAYIPPPLINTVRYWMKRSPTAVWQTLGYDAGRYAYTAVNVSDYFDVNRLRASLMRDCSPSNRISMAYLFENADHTRDGTINAEDFDSFLNEVPDAQGFDTRLVSMADYALAIGSNNPRPTGLKSPFYDFIVSTPGYGMVYAANDPYRANARLQKFVTDSWYPVSLTNLTAMTALTDAAGQPFGGFDPTFDDSFDSLVRAPLDSHVVMQHLNFAERVALKDYLDPDNVPTSLALPTLEHAPMLTGLKVTPVVETFKPQVEEMAVKAETVNKEDGSSVKTTRYLWKLKGFGTPQVLAQATAVFPFKRSSLEKADGDLPGYTAHFFVKAYLLPDGQETDKTRLDSGSVRPTLEDDWKRQNLLGLSQAPCLTFYGSTKVPVKSSRQQESDVVVTCDPVEMIAQTDADLKCPLYGVMVTETTPAPASGGTASKTIAYDTSRFDAELSGGSSKIQYVGKVEDIGKAASKTIAPNETLSLRWQFFVWVRITDRNGKTVDMFPASFKDDKTYNGIDQGMLAQEAPDQLGQPSKEAVVAFKGPLAMKFEQSTFIDATTYQPVPIDANSPIGFSADDKAQTLAIYCGDPRYNWAPEDWFAPGVDTITGDDWLSKVKSSLTGKDCRPRDIFQFVSNQRYLQAMGELQFLPLVRTGWSDFRTGDYLYGTFFTLGRYNGNAFASRTSADSLANAGYMWKNYSFFPDNGSWTDDQYDPYGWGLVDAKDGAVVSPYAEEELMMAALANTPYDYIVTGLAESGDLAKARDGRPYCFNAFSSEARVEWDDLLKVAAKVRDRIVSGEDWWDFEDWTETGDKLFGQSVDCTIHDVDRKFLASYWKSCFANRQQLFLVFVRAEPTVMGAASTGHTPAQLGARAVALVWREPVSSISDSGSSASSTSSARPHRMRILFYHQFE